MSEPDLDRRVALLTGASGGIGGVLGRRLIAAGARVAFTCDRHADQADQLVAEARQAGLDARALAGDLADPRTPARLVDRAAVALGPVDLLIAARPSRRLLRAERPW